MAGEDESETDNTVVWFGGGGLVVSRAVGATTLAQ